MTAKVPIKRIAIVVPNFQGTGGLRTVADFIARAIRRRSDYDFFFVSLPISARDPFSVLLHRPASWFRGISTSNGTSNGESYTHVGARFGEFEFCRFAKRRELTDILSSCDLIQVVAGSPAWAWPVLGIGKPVVLQVATLTKIERRMQSLVGHGLVAHFRQAMTTITDHYDSAALRRVDAVMVENLWMLEHARTIAARRDTIIRYAPPGVDISLFRPATCDLSATPYVLAVGRFGDPRKNVLLLLRAFARAIAYRPTERLNLVLAGPNELPSEFWQHADQLRITDRLVCRTSPSAEELAELYRGAFCLALPSDEEGFGMVVIEAMASGIPVVATRCGGPDAIITDGSDGYLVGRGDVDEMAQRLVRIVGDSNLRLYLGRNARTTVEKRYADDVAGNRFLEVYHELLP